MMIIPRRISLACITIESLPSTAYREWYESRYKANLIKYSNLGGPCKISENLIVGNLIGGTRRVVGGFDCSEPVRWGPAALTMGTPGRLVGDNSGKRPHSRRPISRAKRSEFVVRIL